MMVPATACGKPTTQGHSALNQLADLLGVLPGPATHSPRPGINRIVIFQPPHHDDPCVEVGIHQLNLWPSPIQRRCDAMIMGAPCALCERLADGDGEARSLLRRRTRIWIAHFALALDADQPEQGIMITRLPWTLAFRLRRLRTRGQSVDLASAIQARVIAYKRFGSGLDTKYGDVRYERKPGKGHLEILDKLVGVDRRRRLMANMPDLETMRRATDQDEFRERIDELLASSEHPKK